MFAPSNRCIKYSDSIYDYVLGSLWHCREYKACHIYTVIEIIITVYDVGALTYYVSKMQYNVQYNQYYTIALGIPVVLTM